MDEKIPVGRVLRASTSAFAVGCRQLIAEQDLMTPKLGALLKATGRNGRVVYGLTCNVTIEDDAFVRQLVAAGVESAEIIEDQRQKRQVPIVVDVIIVVPVIIQVVPFIQPIVIVRGVGGTRYAAHFFFFYAQHLAGQPGDFRTAPPQMKTDGAAAIFQAREMRIQIIDRPVHTFECLEQTVAAVHHVVIHRHHHQVGVRGDGIPPT
mgnify:CR=1 FL=1